MSIKVDLLPTTLQTKLENIIEKISNKNQKVKNAVKHVKFVSANNYEQDNKLIIYYFFNELTNNTGYGYDITDGNGFSLDNKTILWSEFIEEIDKNSQSTFKIVKPLFDDESNVDSILNTNI